MAYTLGNKCAKNLCKRIVLLQLIIENVVTWEIEYRCGGVLQRRRGSCGNVRHLINWWVSCLNFFWHFCRSLQLRNASLQLRRWPTLLRFTATSRVEIRRRRMRSWLEPAHHQYQLCMISWPIDPVGRPTGRYGVYRHHDQLITTFHRRKTSQLD